MDIPTIKEIITIVEARIKENKRLREAMSDNLVEDVILSAKITEGQELQVLLQDLIIDDLNTKINLLKSKL